MLEPEDILKSTNDQHHACARPITTILYLYHAQIGLGHLILYISWSNLYTPRVNVSAYMYRDWGDTLLLTITYDFLGAEGPALLCNPTLTNKSLSPHVCDTLTL